jgi:hypothetical protein
MFHFKLTTKYIIASLLAVVFSFFFHELSHWLAGKMLGYNMTMTLNAVTITKGVYLKSWHENFVSAAGPVFTILQAIVAYKIITHNKNMLLYPFLFFPLYMRSLAGVLNFINLNDEGRISNSIGIGTFTLSILVCSLLLFLVIKVSKQNNLSKRFQFINFILAMVFSSVIIMADQFLHIKIIK